MLCIQSISGFKLFTMVHRARSTIGYYWVPINHPQSQTPLLRHGNDIVIRLINKKGIIRNIQPCPKFQPRQIEAPQESGLTGVYDDMVSTSIISFHLVDPEANSDSYF